MRETLTRYFAALTTLLALCGAVLFAWIQDGLPPGMHVDTPAPARIAAGRALFEDQGCALCHGGNAPAYPLRGAARRLRPDQMRAAIAPGEAMRLRFKPEVYDAKQAFRAMHPEELEALVAYVGSL